MASNVAETTVACLILALRCWPELVRDFPTQGASGSLCRTIPTRRRQRGSGESRYPTALYSASRT